MSARYERAGLGLLLGAPIVLAFASGGYTDQPRLWAALVLWSLIVVLTLLPGAVLPRSSAGRMALGGLIGFAAWTALSEVWAPLKDPARHDTERLLLYVAVLIAAPILVRGAQAVRATEVGVAAGALIVVGYGLSERLVPGLLHFHHSISAAGRLEQPLTYWNAMGALAAVGVVLCARLAGDPGRGAYVAASASAAAIPLAMGTVLSFSRGALAALVVGLLMLLALDTSMRQLRAVARTVLLGGAAALVAVLLPAVRTLQGSGGSRELQGLAMILTLLVTGALAAALTRRRHQRPEASSIVARHRRLIPALAVLVCLATVLVSGAVERGGTARAPAVGATAARLGSIESNRYEYWRVALAAFGRHPIIGVGSSGFRVVWLQHRTVAESALNAHSLYVETAAELGVIGVALLAVFLAGVTRSARASLLRHREAATGAVAALAAYALHAGVDWDWQIPAVSIPALILAGGLIAMAEGGPEG